MKTIISILIAAILFIGCGPSNPGVSPFIKKETNTNGCEREKTNLDGTCVNQEIADYVSCVRAQGATLGTNNKNTLSAEVGYFGISAGGAKEVSEKLERKYIASDNAMMAIIEQCNKLSGISSISQHTKIQSTSSKIYPLMGSIPTKGYSASSYWGVGHEPSRARMGETQAWSNWSSKINDKSQWLQVDLGSKKEIFAISTKGRYANKYQWVTSYYVSFSNDGFYWTTYKENGSTKIFQGNRDQNTEVKHTLNSPVTARFIKCSPQTWCEHITRRVEAYGKDI